MLGLRVFFVQVRKKMLFIGQREVVLAVVMRFIVMRSVILLLWINRFIPFRRRDAYCMWVPGYV